MAGRSDSKSPLTLRESNIAGWNSWTRMEPMVDFLFKNGGCHSSQRFVSLPEIFVPWPWKVYTAVGDLSCNHEACSAASQLLLPWPLLNPQGHWSVMPPIHEKGGESGGMEMMETK